MTQTEFPAILNDMTTKPMNDKVKYQLERAQDALREALSIGGSTEDPYLLKHIAETLSTINGWYFVFGETSGRYNLTKENKPDGNTEFKMTTTNYELDELRFNDINYGVSANMENDVLTF